MIAITKPSSSKRSAPAWHKGFLAMLTAIRRHALVSFRGLTPTEQEEAVQEVICNALLAYHRLVELGKEIVADDVVLIEDYAYSAYGVPSEETKEAIRLCARLEGMITDPVYEGKSMQGMIDLVKKGFFPRGSKVLYAHLGGAPAINGYAYTFRNG